MPYVLIGESSVFLILLLAVSALLAWFYMRESRRARGMQAFFAAVTHEFAEIGAELNLADP